MSQTLYIVDGSSYIFRAYYAIRALTNSKGLPTNAIYGFAQMVLKLIEDEKPSHLVMVFDSKEPNFRKIKYPKYKANRESPPEDLVPQFDYIRQVTRALNIPVLEYPGFEADDIIATLVRRTLTQQDKAVIVTGDKDLMQLVNERITLLDTMKNQRIDVAGVKDKFGVTPSQMIDLQALAGDSSDNVPGVPGIGPKTASQLINQYGSLEKLYDHLAEIKGKKRENLEQFKEQAELSQWLVTLSEEVPLSESMADFKVKTHNEKACEELFKELEFQRLLDQFGGKTERLSKKNYELIQDEKALKKILPKLKRAKLLSVDTETTSLDIKQASLVGMSFATAAGKAYYLPLGHQGQTQQLELKATLKALKPLLEDPKLPKVAQHVKYDAGVLQNYDINLQGLQCDTLLASYLLDPSGSHKLDSLSLKYLAHKMISYQEVTGQKQGGLFADVDLAKAKDYACEDADVTWQLAEMLLKKIAEEKLTSLLVEIEQPLSAVLLKMERWGIKIDVPFLKKLQQEFATRIEATEHEIFEIAGETFNIQSPKQLGVILFEKLKLPPVKKTKTGYSTDVEVLTQLSSEHKLPAAILAFRGLAKLKSTYVDALITLADPTTHRVHTHFNQTVAGTGRLSSNDPNLQNIPIRSEDGAKIRQAFVAAPGFVLLSADYSQIELRVLAELSQDKTLLTAFHQDLDVHRMTAASVFDVEESEVSAEMRAKGKTLNFSVIYGQTPFGLAKLLGVTQKEAKHYIEQYLQKYPGVSAFREKILQEARDQGEVRTLLGRRRFTTELNSKNFNLRALAERVAFNTVIQGTAADLIKKAMLTIDAELTQQKLKSRMLLQVHDELVFEVENSELATMKKLVEEKMEGVADFSVPLKVEMGEGASWGEAH